MALCGKMNRTLHNLLLTLLYILSLGFGHADDNKAQCTEDAKDPPLYPLIKKATAKEVYSFFHSNDFAHSYFEEAFAVIRTNGFFLEETLGHPDSIFNGTDYCIECSGKRLKVLDEAFYQKQTKKWMPQNIQFNGSYIRSAIGNGWTVNMDSIHLWPEMTGIRAMARLLSKAFARRTSANGYITAPHLKQSIDAHNDQHDFVVAQISGAKHWKLWRVEKWMLPLVDEKDSVGTRKDNKIRVASLGEPELDIVLRPGDLLYVPRGAIHLTSTSEFENIPETPSYHITFAIALDAFHLPWVTGTRSAPGVPQHMYLHEAFQSAMQQLWNKDRKYRKSVRIGGESYEEWKERLRAAMHDGIDEMLDNSNYMSSVEFMLDRVISAGSAMIEVKPEDRVAEEWDFPI